MGKVLQTQYRYDSWGKMNSVVDSNGNIYSRWSEKYIRNDLGGHLSDIVRHEYGHTKQLEQLGLANYTFCIGVPSALEWGSDPVYYRRPWEITADIYGGVRSRQYPGYETAGFLVIRLN